MAEAAPVAYSAGDAAFSELAAVPDMKLVVDLLHSKGDEAPKKPTPNDFLPSTLTAALSLKTSTWNSLFRLCVRLRSPEGEWRS